MSEKVPKILSQKPEEFFTELLGGVEAPSVLDVACGLGGFTSMLQASLKGFGTITGIDVREEVIAKAKENNPEEALRFEVMDATELDFPDATFDLVSCAFSLHHLPDPTATLAEMRRVLKPGGYLVIVEMYRDHLTEPQQTESIVHHWAAEIDTALGVLHRETYTRDHILQIIQPESWQNPQIFDLAGIDFDPKGEDIMEMMLKTIVRVLEKAKPLPNYQEHQTKALILGERVANVGTHISTRLIFMAQK
jgi:ubiquinone/menaquinone biosynthesis C-methylase UbiE